MIRRRLPCGFLEQQETRWRFGSRLLIAAVLMCTTACTGMQGITESGDVSRSPEAPPLDWDAAVSFDMGDSSRVEFFDGRRARVVSSTESMPEALGRTPYYRVYVRDSAATAFQIRIRQANGSFLSADHLLRIERDAFYTLVIRLGTYDRRSLGTTAYRAYPIPASAQKLPSDSLYVSWGARARGCWTCPS
jgi:hypothetical protein